MYDTHFSRSHGGDRDRDRGGGSVVSERSGRSHNTMPLPHHLVVPSEYQQDEYSGHYHEQEYGRGPNGSHTSSNRERARSGDKYVIHHHYQAPPPTPTVHSSSTVHTSNVSVTSSGHGHKRRPSASNTSVASASGSISRVGEDNNAYIPTLLAEQEAKYGVNMFEYLAPDDPEVTRLMREFSFTRTDAMIAVFQQFPPQLATPTPTHLNSGVSMKSSSSGGTPKGIAAHSPMKPPLINTNHNPNYHNTSGNNIHSTNNNRQPTSTPSTAGAKASSAYDEDAELERVMKLSMQEHNNKPGAVSMPGTSSKTTTSSSNSVGGSMGGGSSQDVATLVGMGFTATQAQTALARHNFDVHKAADYLLGCM